jgi:type VI secretion system protein ImpE
MNRRGRSTGEIMSTSQALKEGRLSDAVAAATAAVKAKPTDLEARFLLCEILAFTGDWPRVHKHLDALIQQHANMAHAIVAFRKIAEAAEAREAFFTRGVLPEFAKKPAPAMELRLQAAIATRAGNLDEAHGLLQRAEEARPRLAGTCNGHVFDDFRDVDDLCASILEVLCTDGKYYWLAYEDVDSLEFPPARRWRDGLWREVKLPKHQSPPGQLFVPMLYPGSFAAEQESLRMGRETYWIGEENEPIRGVGQRMYLVGDEGVGLSQIDEIVFQGTP